MIIVGHFWEELAGRRERGLSVRRKSLAEKLLQTPVIWLDAVADALAGAVPFRRRESGARMAARQALRDAKSAARRAGVAADGAIHDLADEFDRLGGKAARLSRAIENEARLRRRGWFERRLRAPTAGEAVAESAARVREVALGRMSRGGPSWFFPRKARLVERMRAQTAAKLDEMESGLEEMGRRAMAIGDGDAARKAGDALDRLARLRVTVTEDPPPPTVFDSFAQALGARPSPPGPQVRASTSLWPFGARAASKRFEFARAHGAGSMSSYAIAAVSAVAAYALIQSLASVARRAAVANAAATTEKTVVAKDKPASASAHGGPSSGGAV